MAFERVGVEAVVVGLSRFRSGMREVNAAIGLAGEQAKKTQKETEDLNKAMVGLGAGILAASTASAALLGGSIKLAARVETLGVVVEQLGRNVNLTKSEVDDLVEGIRKQGITLRQSRSAFARMVQAQIDFTKGSELARLAQDAAVIANINSSDAFERLIFVITSGNVRMARNLGLQVSFQGAYEKSAKAIGKTTLELTEVEKIQARTNVVLEAGTKIAGSYEAAMTTAGKKVLSLDRQLEESRRILGEAWLPVFADAVDLVTDMLKFWQGLSGSLQESISIFLGVATVAGLVVGSMLVLTPTVIAAGAAFTTLTEFIGLSTLAFGVWAIAIGVVVIAGIKLLAFIKDTKQQTEAVNKTVEDHAKEVELTAGSYDEYAAEIDRVNKLSDENRLGNIRLVKEIPKLTREQFDLNEALRQSDEKLLRVAESYRKTTFGAEDLRTEEEKLADAEREAAAAADLQARNTKFLEQSMKDLSTVISSDLGKNVEKFEKDVAELEQELVDLGPALELELAELEIAGIEDAEQAAEAVDRLNDRRSDAITRLKELEGAQELNKVKLEALNDETSEATRLAAEQRIGRTTTDIIQQKERITELTQEIKDWNEGTLTAEEQQISAIGAIEAEFAEKGESIRAEIADTQKAFSEQTAQFIFDMTQQKLALDGLTREEISFLEQLAGPDGLGIIDQPTLALLGRLDEITEGIAKPGNQVPEALSSMEALFGVFNQGTTDANELADALNRVDIAQFSEVRRFQQGALGAQFGFPGARHGGPASRGRARVVGEGGREVFTPGGSGNIISNRAIQNLGAVMAAAAPVAAPGGGGGGSTNTDNFNLTVNTAAPQEDIESDFEMMRALSGRQRGGL